MMTFVKSSLCWWLDLRYYVEIPFSAFPTLAADIYKLVMKQGSSYLHSDFYVVLYVKYLYENVIYVSISV